MIEFTEDYNNLFFAHHEGPNYNNIMKILGSSYLRLGCMLDALNYTLNPTFVYYWSGPPVGAIEPFPYPEYIHPIVPDNFSWEMLNFTIQINEVKCPGATWSIMFTDQVQGIIGIEIMPRPDWEYTWHISEESGLPLFCIYTTMYLPVYDNEYLINWEQIDNSTPHFKAHIAFTYDGKPFATFLPNPLPSPTGATRSVLGAKSPITEVPTLYDMPWKSNSPGINVSGALTRVPPNANAPTANNIPLFLDKITYQQNMASFYVCVGGPDEQYLNLTYYNETNKWYWEV